MEDLKSYEVLRNIKSNYYVDDNNDLSLEYLKNNIELLSNSILFDLESILESTFIINKSVIYFEDDSYRQGATAYFFKAFLKKDVDFKISIECLVDFDRIEIAARNSSNSKRFLVLEKIIQNKNKVNGFSELKILAEEKSNFKNSILYFLYSFFSKNF